MFAWQNNSGILCNDITMNQHNPNCSYNQAQTPSHYQLDLNPDPQLTASHNLAQSVSWTPGQFIQEAANTGHQHTNQNPYCNTYQPTPLTPEPVPYPVFQLPRPYQNNNVMARKHQARITFVQTKTGRFKTIVKRKRKRTIFTTEQVKALEDIFKVKQYITREEREIIVNQLQINDKAVKIWFQNRRLKDKKGPEQDEEEEEVSNVPSLDERRSPDVARLNYVESKINEKTDEFGYVTLDDGVMGDLYNVIDDFLTNAPHPVEDTSDNSSSSPTYEPISPASVSDSNDEENASAWKPSKPDESLQRLFDLQTLILL